MRSGGQFAVTIQRTGGSPGHMGKRGGSMMMAKSPVNVPMKELNGSGENGSATLRDTPKGLVVTIHIKNAKGPQPAHIHKGTCAKLDPKPEEALHNVVNGMSVTTVPGGTRGALRAPPPGPACPSRSAASRTGRRSWARP